MLKELLGALWTQEIEDALNGKVELIGSEPKIPKSRFDEVNNEKNELKSKVETMMQEIEKANKNSENVEVLNTRIQELQNEYDDFVKGVEKEKVNQVKKKAIVKVLKEKKALTPELLLGYYNLDSITIADDGVLVGAKETTDMLLSKYPDQFGKITYDAPDPKPNESTKDIPFGKMNTTQRIEFKEKDPDGYKKAREAWIKSK